MPTRYGFLAKNLETGEIDTDTRWPVSEFTAQTTELVEGYVWVEVKITFEELEPVKETDNVNSTHDTTAVVR